MKKSVNLVILLSFILVLFLLTACKSQVAGGEKPLDTAAAAKLVQTGTQGVEINTVQNYPPTMIYEDNELVALVELRNKGNHDLQLQDCFVRITGQDPNIIGGDFNEPKACAENNQILEGKNLYNTEGGYNELEFSSTNNQLPEGAYDYSPTLNIAACYKYLTQARPTVCIDPLLYQITSEQKACDYRKSVVVGGGQGAPVGIGYVGANMIGNKAVFEINVVNLGGGRALSPMADIRRCSEDAFDRTDLDKVGFIVELTGGVANCKPQDSLVRLVNNQGKIICTVNLASGPAYETPLMIDLDYSYIKSYRQPIKIIKNPTTE